MQKETPKKSKIYSSRDAAKAYAINVLGLTGWDDHNDQVAYCYGPLSSSRPIAKILPKRRGVKLIWEVEHENRRPKMIGM